MDGPGIHPSHPAGNPADAQPGEILHVQVTDGRWIRVLVTRRTVDENGDGWIDTLVDPDDVR